VRIRKLELAATERMKLARRSKREPASSAAS
jgi:hypothetical protein